jgi:alpha-L-rhamnosidase
MGPAKSLKTESGRARPTLAMLAALGLIAVSCGADQVSGVGSSGAGGEPSTAVEGGAGGGIEEGAEPMPLGGAASMPHGPESAGQAGRAGEGGEAEGGDDAPAAPTGLLCELMPHPELTAIVDSTPEFAFAVRSPRAFETLQAFQILVASSGAQLDQDHGDLWDSGKLHGQSSVDVAYAGAPLLPGKSYLWKVRWWDSRNRVSAWSEPQSFHLADQLGVYSTPREPVAEASLRPVNVVELEPGHRFADFGRDAFGWLEVDVDAPFATVLQIQLGEKALEQGIDPLPGGSVRYVSTQLNVQPGQHHYRVETPKDAQNTSGAAIRLPDSLGVVLPFRYVEVEGAKDLNSLELRQVALHYPYDPAASAFVSDNEALDQIYEFSKYSIIAPTFAGIYVDGDRERIPYEGDAHIQQLGHYSIDRDYALARFSHEYLLDHSTEYTEWHQHSVMLAWTDWMYTGNTESLAHAYDRLVADKTFEDRVTESGLIDTTGLEDLVDWPAGERDGYELEPINTVVNAFFCRNMQQMADIAAALGKADDSARYRAMSQKAIGALTQYLLDPVTSVYVDGIGSTHSSLHANMFPLALGLVPENALPKVVDFVKSRGMACSVYGAQYLLEGLYRVGEADAALALLTSDSKRSWVNMLRAGASITTEAWDLEYKPNEDFNHAWGAAPANIVPRYLLGVRPLSPGFASAEIRPQPGALTHMSGVVPTIRGSVGVAWDASGATPELRIDVPVTMSIEVAIPSALSDTCDVRLDDSPAETTLNNGVRWLRRVGSGRHRLSCPTAVDP